MIATTTITAMIAPRMLPPSSSSIPVSVNTSNPVRIENGRIATSKTDPLSHGFGLMSVCNTLDNLGGEYSYDYDEGWFSFVAEIEK